MCQSDYVNKDHVSVQPLLEGGNKTRDGDYDSMSSFEKKLGFQRLYSGAWSLNIVSEGEWREVSVCLCVCVHLSLFGFICW